MNENNRKHLEDLKSRRKIIWVKPQELIGMFLGASVWAGKLAVSSFNLHLPVIAEQPENILYDYVFYDPSRNSFGIVILHESFDVVPDNRVPPEISGNLETTIVSATITGRHSVGSIPHLVGEGSLNWLKSR